MSEISTEQLQPDSKAISTPGSIRNPESSDTLPSRLALPATVSLTSVFFDRYAFFSLKGILFLFMLDFLGISNRPVFILFHTFLALSFGSSIVGGMLADMEFGRFKTILLVFGLAIFGTLGLSTCAVDRVSAASRWFIFPASLVLCAFGFGGLRSCLASFGADQLAESQVGFYFSCFYFITNMGAFLAMLITPGIKSTPCLGGATCYPLAFSLPLAALIVGVGVFAAGFKSYKLDFPQSDTVKQVVSIVTLSTKHWLGGKQNPGSNFVDRALDHYPEMIVGPVNRFLRIFAMLLPTSFFWMLFDQTSSAWVVQAKQMSGRISLPFLKVTIQPDQMQCVNPLFLLAAIPITSNVIYPTLRRIGYPLKPLNRMTAGMLLGSLAFVAAAIVQSFVDASPINDQDEHATGICVLFQLPQLLCITFAEIMLSMTGIEFAYTEAPASMKGVCQASFNMMIGAGNLLVVFFKFVGVERLLSATHPNRASMLLFSAVNGVATLYFWWKSQSFIYQQVSLEEHGSSLMEDEEIPK